MVFSSGPEVHIVRVSTSRASVTFVMVCTSVEKVIYVMVCTLGLEVNVPIAVRVLL